MTLPNVFLMTLRIVTFSWVALSPSSTVTVLSPVLSYPLRAATASARARALGRSWGR